MAITFPRAIPDELKLVGLSFHLMPQVEVTPLRSGKQIANEVGPSLWMGEFSSGPMDEEDYGILRAWLDTLSHDQLFLGYDRLRQYPLAYKSTGWEDLFVGSDPFDGIGWLDDVASNNVEIDLTMLPSGFILSAGDYLSFTYGIGGANRALHRIVAGGTANGSGELTVEVRPDIREGWDNSFDNYVNFYRPAAEMIILPDTVKEEVDGQSFGTVRFQAVQSL